MNVAIMKKRGRPKIVREEMDYGTPELQFKRAHSVTVEALDLCLERQIINEEQHWCGIHLRWLYTLRYGAPGLQALDLMHIHGTALEMDDPEWRAAREQEHREAIECIAAKGFIKLLMAICIHNERPMRSDIHKLQEGLGLLLQLWKKKK